MSVEELAPGIYITRVFETRDAAALVSAAASNTSWQDAGVNANLDVDRSVRDADVLFEADDPASIALCRDRLFAATRGIAAAVAPKTVLAEIQIVRYRAGGRYVDHRDTPALGATPRALSLVCYLNDDFSGGETVFTDPDLSIPPASGMVIAFSPVLLHRAQPVISGCKYVITAWYHVPPPG